MIFFAVEKPRRDGMQATANKEKLFLCALRASAVKKLLLNTLPQLRMGITG